MSEILRRWRAGEGLPGLRVIDGHTHVGEWPHGANFETVDEMVDGVVAVMDANGVDAACVMAGGYMFNGSDYHIGNDILLELWRRLGDRIIPFAHFNANDEAESILTQLKRFPTYVKEYDANLAVYNEAIADCTWLRNRTVPKPAKQSGYIWACLWEGDKHGLSLKKFKKILAEEKVDVGFHFTERPATKFDIFRGSTAYHKKNCPIRCPYYKGSYRPEKAELPVATEILNRVMTAGVVERTPAKVRANARRLRRAIKRMENE